MAFVTGGTGLVGARLIYDLVSEGELVTALIRPDTSPKKFIELIKHYCPNPEAIAARVSWINGDMENISDLLEILQPGDFVYHCAAKVSFNQSDKAQIIETNVEGTANLVNACLQKKVEKLCHVSSIGALGGKINGQQIDEETPWAPGNKSVYSLSKHYSELEVWRGMAEGLNAVIVNPSVILGAGNWNLGSPSLFKMVGKGLKFYTLGSTGYIDVRDVTKAMILLMKSAICNERFILSSENLTYKALFTKIAQAIQAKPPVIYANRVVTGIAFRFEKLRSIILQTQPKLTKQTHIISHTVDNYSGKKICEHLNFSYTPIDETIKFIGNCYLNN